MAPFPPAACRSKTRRACKRQQVHQDLNAALLAAAASVSEPPQASLWFALRAAVLRLAVRGLSTVAHMAVAAVAPAVVLGRFNSRRSGCGATVRSWPAARNSSHQSCGARGLTLCSTGHLAAARTWPSFHSGPSAVCRKAPVTLYVRPSNACPWRVTVRSGRCSCGAWSSAALASTSISTRRPRLQRPRAGPRRDSSAAI